MTDLDRAVEGLASLRRFYLTNKDLRVDNPDPRAVGAKLSTRFDPGAVEAHEAYAAAHAKVLTLTDEVAPVIDSAAASFPDPFRVHATDFGEPCGLLWLPPDREFATSLLVGEGNDHQDGRASGVLWHADTAGVLMVYIMQAHGQTFPTIFSHYPYDLDFTFATDGTVGVVDPKTGRIRPDHRYTPESATGGRGGVLSADARRFVLATLRLAWQRVFHTATADGGRAFTRRTERAHVDPSDVLTVTLRRYRHDGSPDPEDPGFVEWSHRWLVGGHWREQWYPSLNDHRTIWISPYVKGPADKPLLVKERRYVFDR